jgi:zinc protease
MEFPATNASLHALPNGLTAILQEDHAAPVLSAQFWIETGSQHEEQFAGSGLSHLLEHMVFKGTKSYPGAELATRVNSAGGQWNAYTTFDRTVYYIDGPSTARDTFLEVLFELVFLPLFPKDDFETEREVIRREIAMGNDDPDSAASHLLFRTFFQHDSRRHPVIGHLGLFNALSYEDMTGYHQRRYLPSNSFFVLSGDFESAAVIETLSTLAASLPAQPLSEVNGLPEPRQLGRREARSSFQVPVSKTTLAWQTPGLTHPDSPVLELLSGILGGGQSSYLYRRLHEELGLAHHIGTWAWSPPNGPGMFSVSAEVDREKRDQLEASVLSEIKQAMQGDLEGELDKARRQVFAQQFKTLSTASGRASDLASNWHEARNLNFTRDYLEFLDDVTVEDLTRVADLYLREDGLTIISLDPEEAPAPKATVARNGNAPGDIITRELSNGLTLILRSDPRVPTVQFQSVFQAGRLAETTDTCGINALHSSLLTKGTEARSASDFANAVESLGASVQASAGNNTSMVSSFCLKPDLRVVLGLAAEALRTPAFREETLDQQREVQHADLREALEDPLKTTFLLLRKKLFGEQHYGLPRLGTEESLSNISPDSLLAHHREFMTRSNGVLAVFGDIDPEAIVEQCEELFADLPQGSSATARAEATKQSGEVSATLDKEQAVVAIGFPGATVDSDDVPALELIHDYCANMAGPLFTRLREELGLAYYVSATQFHGVGTGLFAFYIGTSPDQVDLARRELLQQIQILLQDGVPAEPLEHAKTSMLASDAMENQSNHAMAQMCSLNTLFGLGPLHHLEHAKRIRALTVQDVQETAQRYFGVDPVIATVSPGSGESSPPA